MAAEEERLERMLNQWGEWCMRGRQAPALGYSSRTVEARLRDEGGVLMSGSGSRKIIEVDEESEMMEMIIGAMRSKRAIFAEILEQKYVWGRKQLEVADHVRLSVATVKVYSAQALAWLSGAVTMFEHRMRG